MAEQHNRPPAPRPPAPRPPSPIPHAPRPPAPHSILNVDASPFVPTYPEYGESSTAIPRFPSGHATNAPPASSYHYGSTSALRGAATAPTDHRFPPPVSSTEPTQPQIPQVLDPPPPWSTGFAAVVLPERDYLQPMYAQLEVAWRDFGPAAREYILNNYHPTAINYSSGLAIGGSSALGNAPQRLPANFPGGSTHPINVSRYDTPASFDGLAIGASSELGNASHGLPANFPGGSTHPVTVSRYDAPASFDGLSIGASSALGNATHGLPANFPGSRHPLAVSRYDAPASSADLATRTSSAPRVYSNPMPTSSSNSGSIGTPASTAIDALNSASASSATSTVLMALNPASHVNLDATSMAGARDLSRGGSSGDHLVSNGDSRTGMPRQPSYRDILTGMASNRDVATGMASNQDVATGYPHTNGARAPENDLRPMKKDKIMFPCVSWKNSGRCNYGDNCRFLHVDR